MADLFKSPEHADNYEKFATTNDLRKYDGKRKCILYYHEHKLEKHGISRTPREPRRAELVDSKFFGASMAFWGFNGGL